MNTGTARDETLSPRGTTSSSGDASGPLPDEPDGTVSARCGTVSAQGGTVPPHLVDAPEPSRAALAAFNAMPADSAAAALLNCCPWAGWAEAVAADRPYADAHEAATAVRKAMTAVADADLPRLLSRYPAIGTDPGRGVRADFSRREEAGVHSSGVSVLAAVAEGNAAYEARFGCRFVMSTAGFTGDDIVVAQRERLTNSRETEFAIVRRELAKIACARLNRFLTGLEA